MLVTEYLGVLIFFCFSLGLSSIIFGLSYVLAKQNADPEKLSAYECGFDPFTSSRATFDVRFYLVAILFIIFDLEVAFLFPWALTLSSQTMLGFWNMFLFLFILTIGFLYEWRKGALDWE
uniref:NADH-ubiquinone oxidoreductase chain 3 n=1 Tax=Jakoba libera TaxID=143017 RepID=M4QC97_JAKLI|nr:NADH dehydrogenase subunit 3 [Jakoba libera]AGH24189.1 NADH dehydrogenase subunit 3 [Jakoba libera]